MNLTLTMVAAAAAVGAVHTLAPDHWVPFAALARAERWSASRTTLVTAACGLGHVTVSAALGLLALLFGLEVLQTFGARLESAAGRTAVPDRPKRPSSPPASRGKTRLPPGRFYR